MSGDIHANPTLKRRIAQYNDRWSSHVFNSAILSISDKLTAGQLREFEIFGDYKDKFLEKISPDVAVVKWKSGALLFEEGTYIDLAFFVVSGEVEVTLKRQQRKKAVAASKEKMPVAPARPAQPEGTVMLDLVTLAKQNTIRKDHREIALLSNMDFNLGVNEGARLGPGELFGEIGVLSGWPQPVTARTITDCTLIQIRLPALRLMKNKSPKLKERLDRLYRERSLFSQLKITTLFAGLSDEFLERLVHKVDFISLEPNQQLLVQGEAADAFYLVRSGFIKLAQRFGQRDMVVTYLSKGMTLGEVELLIDDLQGWESTATSVEYAELIQIPKQVFEEILVADPEIEETLWKSASQRVSDAGYSKQHLSHSQFTESALDMGLVQGNSILVIDLESCTRCDDCVRACAATHGGRPRFIREGTKLGNLLIPKSCYHCRDPVCLVGCPTGAIHRAGATEVIKVDPEICIGCSTCANNCPYDAIVMHDLHEQWPMDMVPSLLRGTDRYQASKCDLCQGTGHGPACVSNCPQGCAIRVGSLGELKEWYEGG